MKNIEGWYRADDVKTETLVLEIDPATKSWIEEESKRSHLPKEDVALAFLRKACAEKTTINIFKD